MGDALLKVEHLPQRGWTDFETAQDVVEGELGKGPYLFGDWFTAADVMIGSMFIWKRIFGAPPEPPGARGLCRSTPGPSEGDEVRQMILLAAIHSASTTVQLRFIRRCHIVTQRH